MFKITHIFFWDTFSNFCTLLGQWSVKGQGSACRKLLSIGPVREKQPPNTQCSATLENVCHSRYGINLRSQRTCPNCVSTKFHASIIKGTIPPCSTIGLCSSSPIIGALAFSRNKQTLRQEAAGADREVSLQVILVQL